MGADGDLLSKCVGFSAEGQVAWRPLEDFENGSGVC